ncbi:MAG: ATP-binding protein [Solirubrobacterales bacterium]
MADKSGELLIYGFDNICEKIDNIIEELDLKEEIFEIKLIMMEAVTNAVLHGNAGDVNKLVKLKYQLSDETLIIKVKDSGNGFNKVKDMTEINENRLYDESGRGLYLIECFADKVQYEGNSIIMTKYICKGE